MFWLRTAATLVIAVAGVAAGAWTFEDASLTVQEKGAGIGSGTKEQLSASSPLSSVITLGSSATLKIVLTAIDEKSASRPHQAFLTLREIESDLEESFPFSVKDNGKARVDLAHKDLPLQFLKSAQPIEGFIVLGSFGSSLPFRRQSFKMKIEKDLTTPLPALEASERFAAKPEIHHVFRGDPRSPAKAISVFFALTVLAALPLLLGVWAMSGANVGHLGSAFGKAAVAHGLFYGSIVGIEGVFFLYYLSWTLFQMLPVALTIGVVAYVSGSKALTEVQERRSAGER